MGPIILIPVERKWDEETKYFQHKLFSNYVDAVATAGGQPLLVPLVPGAEYPEELADLADGLLISGGGDICPWRYGAEITELCDRMDENRDALELQLMDAFVKRKKPILGICRGMQVINCYFGGTFWQDLPSQKGVVHRNTRHFVTCEKGSFMEQLFGESLEVNSFHHQSVLKAGKDLKIVAMNDDIVEAIEHVSLPIWGAQFHPERMTGNEKMEGLPEMLPLFELLVNESRKQDCGK